MGWFHNTLLVKDFNSHGEFEVDSSFRNTADVPWIALDGIIDGKNHYTGNCLARPEEMFPFKSTFISWMMKDHYKYKINCYQYYTVHDDNIFDIKSWSAENVK